MVIFHSKMLVYQRANQNLLRIFWFFMIFFQWSLLTFPAAAVNLPLRMKPSAVRIHGWWSLGFQSTSYNFKRKQKVTSMINKCVYIYMTLQYTMIVYIVILYIYVKYIYISIHRSRILKSSTQAKPWSKLYTGIAAKCIHFKAVTSTARKERTSIMC